MKILDSLKNIYEKKNIEKREYPEFDVEAYKEVAGISDFIEEKDISKTLKLALGVFGVNGIYLFFVTKDTDPELIKASVQTTIKKLELLIPNIAIFVRAEELDYYYNGSDLIEKEYLLDCFTNIYQNTQLSSMTLRLLGLTEEQMMGQVYEEQKYENVEDADENAEWHVADRVSTKQLELIFKKISEYEIPAGDVKEITVDGVKFAKHAVKTKIFGYSYADQYFPVSSTNPTRFLLITLFGGLIGIHKLITKEYGKFVLYLLTCGGLGVLYVLDVISIATGGYYINQVDYEENEDGGINKSSNRLYLDKVPRITLRLASVVIAAVLAFGTVKYGYFQVLRQVSYGITKAGVERYEKMQKEYDQKANDALNGNIETEGSEDEWQVKPRY